MNSSAEEAVERSRRRFLQACELDVAVRKPGNVSQASPGHGMDAAHFLASARAAAPPLCRRGASVGERIEAAVAASWAAAGCNTNLGIVLLCAPIAAAIERFPASGTPQRLRAAIVAVLAGLEVEDARAAYRAIARARPGGLGSAPEQDVRDTPDIDLRAAMALAADRDTIALQYRNGYEALFGLGLAALPAGLLRDTVRAEHRVDREAPPRSLIAAVQRVYLAFLAAFADAHLLRKHGAPVAQSVMGTAQQWQRRVEEGHVLDTDPAFIAWDAELKSAGLNPGTSADLTVATLYAAGLVADAAHDA